MGLTGHFSTGWLTRALFTRTFQLCYKKLICQIIINFFLSEKIQEVLRTNIFRCGWLNPFDPFDLCYFHIYPFDLCYFHIYPFDHLISTLVKVINIIGWEVELYRCMVIFLARFSNSLLYVFTSTTVNPALTNNSDSKSSEK